MSVNLKKIKKLPDSPGVYFFLGKRGEALYVGRATSLRDRVMSYFGSDLLESRSPLIVKLIEKASSIDFRKTDSVLEAVLLEADLINKFKPPYNTDLKDDKSWNLVVITDEIFPRVLIVREKDLGNKLKAKNYKLKARFGPFPDGGKLAIALKIIRKIFPFRDRCEPPKEGEIGKPCFNRQIGLCPGVCSGEISEAEYKKTISNIIKLFAGKKKDIVRALRKDMNQAAKRQEFEGAMRLKRAIAGLSNIADVALVGNNNERSSAGRVEAFDVAHISETDRVGVMTVVKDGVPDKTAYRKFKIKNASPGDVPALKEILERRFNHEEWGWPNVVVVGGGKAQLNATRAVIKTVVTNQKDRPFVTAVVKDDRHRPKMIIGDLASVLKQEKEILAANAEAHRFALSFHRKRRGKLIPRHK